MSEFELSDVGVLFDVGQVVSPFTIDMKIAKANTFKGIAGFLSDFLGGEILWAQVNFDAMQIQLGKSVFSYCRHSASS
jgi:hypothetical protein